MKRPDGVTVIALYHFLISALEFFLACALLIGLIATASTATASGTETGDPSVIAAFFLAIFTLLAVLGGGFAILAGWGLLGMKNWARWLTIVLSGLSLPLFPIGTLIGGVTIWYLLQDEVAAAFEETAQLTSTPKFDQEPVPDPQGVPDAASPSKEEAAQDNDDEQAASEEADEPTLE